MPSKGAVSPSVATIERYIYLIRSQKVVLDIDLANLYGVTTKRLNEQVKRNIDRFPTDFMFQLSYQEVSDLRSQFATANWRLNSKIAVEASILVVRVFMRLREMLYEHSDLKRRLQDIEIRLARGFAAHEQELQEIRFLISQLEQPIEIKHTRIGFKNSEEE